MDHLISRHPDAAAIRARVARVGVARMVGVKVISLRPQVLIHLNAHPHRVAGRGLRHIIIDQIVSLKHLQRERHLRVTERPLDHPHEHLTRLGQAPGQQAFHVVKAQDAAHVTAALVHPLLPCLVNLAVNGLIQLPATQHPHLSLVLDAVPDHVVLDAPYRLPRIVVVAHKLPRPVAQCLKARLDLAVSAGATCHPVSRQPAHARTAIRPRPWLPDRLKSHRLEQPRAQSHQNLTNRLCGLPSPLAISSAICSRLTSAFSLLSSAIKSFKL